MANATMAEPTLNTGYVLEEEDNRVSFPALQADCYQPRNLKEAIGLGVSEDSFNMLPESSQRLLQGEFKQVFFGEKEVLFFQIPKVRIVLLSMPRLFVVDKETGVKGHLKKGVKISGTSLVTIARVFVLLIADDDTFVLGHDGSPQVFTLNLRSTKTELLGNHRSQPGDGTIASLNAGLRKYYKVTKGWLAHLVCVQLVAEGCSRKSSVKKDASSFGIDFRFEGTAKILPEAMQAQAFAVAQNKDFKALVADPFGLGSKSDNAAPPVEDEPADEVDEDEIPF